MGDNNAQGQIVVKVSVQSAEALANLKAFTSTANSQMAVFSTAATTTTAGMNAVALSAEKATMRIAGMSYYARGSIDAIRFAAGGGGTRAAFYALDESLRGVLASGMELSTLVPIVGIVTAAATAGYLIWREYTSAEREAEKAAKDLHDQMKRTVDVFKVLIDQQKAGLLSSQAVDKYRDILTGKTPVYKTRAGTYTLNPTETIEQPSPGSLGISGSPVLMPNPFASTKQANIQNQQLSQLEAVKYVQDQLAVQGKLTDAMVEASAKRKKLVDDMANESGNENEKEKQRIHDRYQSERDELKATEIAMGSLLTEKQKAADDALLKQSEQDEADEKKAVDFKQQDKERREAEAAYREGQAMYAKEYAEKSAENEHAITQAVAEGSMNRTDQIEYEYQHRMDFEMSMALQGISTEAQYTKAVTEAAAERAKAIKAENLEKEKALDLVEEQQKREGQRDIEQNPFMTDAQKYGALKMFGAMDNRTRGADPNSFQEQFLSQMVHVQNEWGTMAQQMAKVFSSNLTTAINATSQAFTKLIMGTMTWKQALQSIESSILNELINAIIKMFEQWVVGMVLQYTVGKALGAANLAANAGLAAGESAIWATPATLATIASYGGAAYSAPGIIAAATLETMAGVAGREFGGPVQAGIPYVVGEKRAELFVPEQNGYVYPRVPGNTSTLTQQQNDSAGNVEVHIHNWPDEGAANKYARDNPTFNHILQNKAKRSTVGYRPK